MKKSMERSMEIKEFGEQNKPIILLIHGFCMPLSMWESQIKGISQRIPRSGACAGWTC